MHTKNIYSSMGAKEITTLIETSPSNLLDFFKDSMNIQDKGIPSFGKLKDEPVTYQTTLTKELMSDYLNMIVPVEDDDA